MSIEDLFEPDAETIETEQDLPFHFLHIRNRSGQDLSVTWAYYEEDKRLEITINPGSEENNDADIQRDAVSQD